MPGDSGRAVANQEGGICPGEHLRGSPWPWQPVTSRGIFSGVYFIFRVSCDAALHRATGSALCSISLCSGISPTGPCVLCTGQSGPSPASGISIEQAESRLPCA